MTTIHAQLIGDQASLPKTELERLVELARRAETIEVEWQDEEMTTRAIMSMAERGRSFDFWKQNDEDIYTIEDGEAV
jgi:hypothetical protein